MNFKNLQCFLAAALSVGAVHAQSVVIDGGSIRVDAGSSAKATVGAKTNKNHSAKKSKTVIAADSDDDNDRASVIVNGDVSSTGTVATGSVSGRTGAIGGRKEFVNSDLSGQNLSRLNYAGASFTNVEAVGTNFNGADLSRAVMTNVDLSKADLRGANLTGAQMVNVDWAGAMLGGAIWMDGRRCAQTSTGKCR